LSEGQRWARLRLAFPVSDVNPGAQQTKESGRLLRTKGMNRGTFAFWFVERYGPNEDIEDSPSTFWSLTIVIYIRRITTNGNTNLGFHIL
jgi:hypothetical protein